jgi:hypothetical protein
MYSDVRTELSAAYRRCKLLKMSYKMIVVVKNNTKGHRSYACLCNRSKVDVLTVSVKVKVAL